jgi:hypothetical protein
MVYSSRAFTSYLEVADNLRERVASTTGHFLHDVAQVVNEEVERLSVLSNGSKLHVVSTSVYGSGSSTYKSVYCTDNIAYEVRNVAYKA